MLPVWKGVDGGGFGGVPGGAGREGSCEEEDVKGKNESRKEVEEIMTEMLVFDETLQKRKISRLTKSIKYLSPIQSIVYALRQWGHVSQSEIANSLYCSQAYVAGVEKKTRMILPGEQFPESFIREELIMPSNISNGGLVLLKKLTSIQAFIGALRLGLLENQREIAKILDCSQPYVQMLERKSKVILGQCEIVEIWNRIYTGTSLQFLSPRKRAVFIEQSRIEKKRQKERDDKERAIYTESERKEIQKRRQSESAIQYWKSPEALVHKQKLSEKSAERQRQWAREPRNINKAEQQLLNFLIQWGFLYKYWGDATIWIGIPAAFRRDYLLNVQGCRNPDFVHRFFPGIIELYGEYWHEEEKLENGGDNGQSKIDHYAIFGYHTLIIWESEVRDALKTHEMALNLYNKLLEFELKLRGEFQSEFGINFPTTPRTFSNPA